MFLLCNIDDNGKLTVMGTFENATEAKRNLEWKTGLDNMKFVLIPVRASLEFKTTNYGYNTNVQITYFENE